MIFTQHYLACLSQASYVIGDETTGRAVVVDRRRAIGVYLEEAAAKDLTIERVIETHVHADFLAGHLELAARAGAVIAFGEGANVAFAAEALQDGQRLSLGEVTLEILATPGHTPEPICIVVYAHPDAAGRRRAVLRPAQGAPVAAPRRAASLLPRRDGGAVLLDAREPADFAAAHLRGAVNVGLQGRFAEWAGAVLEPDRDVVLVGDPAIAVEAKVRLGRVGYDRVVGQLDDLASVGLGSPELIEAGPRP